MISAWLLRSCTRPTRLVSGALLSSTCRQTTKPSAHIRPFSLSTTAWRDAQSTLLQNEHARSPRVAIIGSGPAGFYTARKLMKEVNGTKVDMYEQLPVPFGLVRFGVAPDHPEVKNCQDDFEEVAASPDYNFIGNVQLGQDLPLPILSKHYDAIVFAYGASKDRQLGLKGEEKSHIYSARAFVGWYNGLPEYRNLDPDLQAGKTAIVVGQGNVAMDVARILLSSTDILQKTDLTSYAIEALTKSTIRHVRVVGRRGPMQAAFTIKEVRELIQLPNVNFTPVNPNLFPPGIKSLPRPKRRLIELLQKGKPHDPHATKSWSLDFCLAPALIQWADDDANKLTGVTFTQTQLVDLSDPSSRVTSTDKTQLVPTSTLFRSIGYRAEAIPGMDLIGATFDERAGTLRHDGIGRILPLDTPAPKAPISVATPDMPQRPQAVPPAHTSLYCAGWVKRGPTGVIASTMTDAFQTAEAIVQDWRNALVSSAVETDVSKAGWSGVKADAESQGYSLDKVVNWNGWHRIDQAEKKAGNEKDKPREKIGGIGEMLEIAGS